MTMTGTIEQYADQMAAEAREKELGRPCPVCKLYPFYLEHGNAIRTGHVYSWRGRDELKITGMCEYCWDQMEPEDDRAQRTGGQFDPDIPHDLPLEGMLLQTVTNLDDYDVESGRYDTTEVGRAQVITSVVGNGRGIDRRHKVVLDIDMPAKLIPSSTPGHFHLYIDHEMEEGAYMELLVALGKAGILEEGYVRASQARKLTAVRLPWVKKPEPSEEAPF